MTTSNEARQRSSSLAEAAPLLQEIEHIDQRLPLIDEELRTLAGLLPKPEIVARLIADLERQRLDFLRDHRDTYDMAVHVGDIITALSADPPRRLQFRDSAHVMQVLAWLLGPLLEQSVPRAVDALTYTAGPSTQERRDRREALTNERVHALARREQLVNKVQAIAGGVLTIKHLPETAERLDQERRTRAEQQRMLDDLREHLAKRVYRVEAVEHNRSEINRLERLLGEPETEWPAPEKGRLS